MVFTRKINLILDTTVYNQDLFTIGKDVMVFCFYFEWNSQNELEVINL